MSVTAAKGKNIIIQDVNLINLNFNLSKFSTILYCLFVSFASLKIWQIHCALLIPYLVKNIEPPKNISKSSYGVEF